MSIFDMQTLPESFEFDNYIFRLVKRLGLVAMLEKRRRNWVANVGYLEVVLLQVHPARSFPSGKSYPEREAMPPSEDWGVNGWSFFLQDKAKADARFNALIKAQESAR